MSIRIPCRPRGGCAAALGREYIGFLESNDRASASKDRSIAAWPWALGGLERVSKDVRQEPCKQQAGVGSVADLVMSW